MLPGAAQREILERREVSTHCCFFLNPNMVGSALGPAGTRTEEADEISVTSGMLELVVLSS